mmetsp:Transcript_93987/g.251624  ORF Transcript_93987/g.251624 Transcript_93987/m.251624 type:complete len:425 (+) Transcript_93987:47-1321(+)
MSSSSDVATTCASFRFSETPALACGKPLLTRDELTRLEGSYYVYLFARYGSEWLPVQLVEGRKTRHMGGMIASGIPLVPGSDLAPDGSCRFRLELPRAGDVSQVFLRGAKPGVAVANEEPYVLFVRDVLAQRDRHTNKDVKKMTWERLELRAPFGTFLSTDAHSIFIHSHQTGKAVTYCSSEGIFRRVPLDSQSPTRFAFALCDDPYSVPCDGLPSEATVMLNALAGVSVTPRPARTPKQERCGDLANSLAGWVSAKSTMDVGELSKPVLCTAMESGIGAEGASVEHDTDTAEADLGEPCTDLLQVLGSVTKCGKTGKILENMSIHRGSVREETISFLCRGDLVNLRRTAQTAKKIGWTYANVALDIEDFGSYKASPDPQSFTFPAYTVPSHPFARGSYRCQLTYTCDNVAGPVLTECFEFCIL